MTTEWWEIWTKDGKDFTFYARFSDQWVAQYRKEELLAEGKALEVEVRCVEVEE